MKKFLVSILSAALVLAGCTQEIVKTYSEVNVSSSYIGIPANGGSSTIEVNTTDSWQISGAPDWLTISPDSGVAGTSSISISAEAAEATREAVILVNCAGKQQHISVIQMCEKVDLPISTCAQVIAGDDGKIYRVKGTVTAIANTQYGNWYLNDGTGEVYIYGTLDKNGAEKNFLSLGIEVGDIVTCEGPRTDYAGTIELVNVTVVKLEKSLIKVTSDDVNLDLEGGDFDVTLEVKGEGVGVVIPEEAKSWLSVNAINISGKDATVSFNAAPNELGDRSVQLTFTTNNGAYSAVTNVNQKGAIIETTADVINAAEDGATQYRITGYVTRMTMDKDDPTKPGVYGNYYIKDHTGEVYVYGTLDAEGKTKNFASLGIKEGDIVTVVGPKSSYKNAAQMVNVTVEKHISVEAVSVADFLAKDVKSDVYYQLSGEVTNYKDGDAYGNFDLVDETGSVYVYGVLKGWGGAKKLFPELGVKNGDKITIVGVRAAYNGNAQVGSAFYVSHEAAE